MRPTHLALIASVAAIAAYAGCKHSDEDRYRSPAPGPYSQTDEERRNEQRRIEEARHQNEQAAQNSRLSGIQSEQQIEAAGTSREGMRPEAAPRTANIGAAPSQPGSMEAARGEGADALGGAPSAARSPGAPSSPSSEMASRPEGQASTRPSSPPPPINRPSLSERSSGTGERPETARGAGSLRDRPGSSSSPQRYSSRGSNEMLSGDATVQLTAFGGSNISGGAAFIDRPGGTQFTVDVRGGKPGRYDIEINDKSDCSSIASSAANAPPSLEDRSGSQKAAEPGDMLGHRNLQLKSGAAGGDASALSSQERNVIGYLTIDKNGHGRLDTTLSPRQLKYKKVTALDKQTLVVRDQGSKARSGASRASSEGGVMACGEIRRADRGPPAS